MKFVLFVEGHTEKLIGPALLKRWLDPQLRERVGIKIVRFEGWHDYVKEIRKKVELNLSGKTGADVIACIGLLDLYGPTFYPPGVETADDRWAWAKRHLQDEVGNDLFRQHFAVHELEAWLLADPSILPAAVKNALPGKSERPETINFDEPPAKLLERVYREKLKRRYKKTVDGASLFSRLDPQVAYNKCPYFKRLADDMLELAKEAGL